jgi:L-threonylcarbamoyladenylate synthase
VPDEITAGTGAVGVRIPGSAIARDLAAAAGGALVSTSANLSAGPPPASAEAFAPEVLSRIDGLLDGGPTPGGLPSTVVEAGEGGPRLLRAGAIPWAAVLEALR